MTTPFLGSPSPTEGTSATSAPPPACGRVPYAKPCERAARLAAVVDIIRRNGGRMPSHLDILARLKDAGIKSSKGTVQNDLFALGYTTAPSSFVRHSDRTSPTPAK